MTPEPGWVIISPMEMTTELNNRTSSILKAIWKEVAWLLSWMPGLLLVLAAPPIIVYAWDVMQNVDMTSLSTENSLDLTRNAILLLGVLGGAYGLYIAARRQRVFQAQLFSEQLGQGVELMTNNNGAIRRAGLRVLYNLADNAEPYNEELILTMIREFVKETPAPQTTQAPGGEES